MNDELSKKLFGTFYVCRGPVFLYKNEMIIKLGFILSRNRIILLSYEPVYYINDLTFSFILNL